MIESATHIKSLIKIFVNLHLFLQKMEKGEKYKKITPLIFVPILFLLSEKSLINKTDVTKFLCYLMHPKIRALPSAKIDLVYLV